MLFFVLLNIQCKSQELVGTYNTETLKIIPISEHSFVHVSYINTSEYGKVACNGLIYINKNEAVVFDTPTDKEASKELLQWLTVQEKLNVTAVVINHFHTDCLGGLQAFHEYGIPSYANNMTITLAKNKEETIPQIGFDIVNEIEVGGEKIVNRYFGEAHTKDNIVSYIQSEGLLYGGCSIKSLGASKGNLNDANTLEWSGTVSKIKESFTKLKIVIPGHGKHGGVALLDYTITLFKKQSK